MSSRLRATALILITLVMILFCGSLPKVISEYQDRSIEGQVYSQNIKDLSMTVVSPSPFAKLYLASSKMSIVSASKNRAIHTEEEIYAMALKYFTQYQDAGLIGSAFTVSDYECSFRMHAAESYNYFWHVNLYCRADPYGNDTGSTPFLILTLTLDDETGKVYALYYAETTEMDSGRPVKSNTEVVRILAELYGADLDLSEIGNFDPDTVSEYDMDVYYDIVFSLTDKTVLDETVEVAPSLSPMSMVYIEIYATAHSFYIDVAPILGG